MHVIVRVNGFQKLMLYNYNKAFAEQVQSILEKKMKI